MLVPLLSPPQTPLRSPAVVLLEPDRTQFDLSWRMFGIRVRVHPMFWLVAALLGAYFLQEYGFGYLLLWIGCVFVSVLVHELGHVVMGRIFGARGDVILYAFGGLATGANDLHNRWQRIAVSAAGPAAGFGLWGLVLLVQGYLPHAGELGPGPDPVALGAVMLVTINLAWSILNLLPIWPLDGGMISRELFSWVSPYNGLRLSLGLSLVVAAVLAVHCLMRANGRTLLPFLDFGTTYTAILFGMLAIENLLLLQQVRSGPRYRDDYDPWER
jgi:Zn-dependent protease